MGVSLYPDWAADSFWRVLRREIKLEPLGRKRPGSTEARSTSSLARRALMRSRGVSACPARARPSRFVLLAGAGGGPASCGRCPPLRNSIARRLQLRHLKRISALLFG